VSEDLPLYSEIELIHDTGRVPAADAETGDEDSFRRDFSQTSRSNSAGAFGRSPEAQREVVEADLPPVTPDEALAVLGENITLRARVEDAESEAEWANDSRLDERAYATYETREDYEDAADELLEAGGGHRLFALTESWSEADPAGAVHWAEQAEYAATVAAAQAGAQAAQQEQHAMEAVYAQELADFYAAHPEYRTGTTKNTMLAQSLAADPTIGASPDSFRSGLQAAREVVEDVSGSALKAVDEMSFRSAFRDQAFRTFRPPAAEHTAAAAARRIEPSSVEELTTEILARAKGTRAQRQAALQERDDDFRAQFAQAARGSGFGEGAREQAARALTARDEERAGKRAPNRAV
jgi:hypothetical protein